MRAKPILLWPKAHEDIQACLGWTADEFLVVDTNRLDELQKLDGLKRTVPVFDPYPGYGQKYREFCNGVAADSNLHIAGLDICRQVLQALADPSLGHASVEEIYGAVAPTTKTRGFHQTMTAWAGWSSLDWIEISISAVAVFVAVLLSNALFNGNSLLLAVSAALVFSILHWCAGLTIYRSRAPK